MASRRKLAVNPRKHPEQDRSRATVDTILSAAAHVLVKAGYEAFTTNRVAERAGVSIGSLYQYFPNKDALLSELMKRHLAEIEASLDFAMQDITNVSLEQLIRTAVEKNVRSHLIDPDLHRVLSEEVPQLGHLDWKKEQARRIDDRVRALLQMKQNEIRVPDLDLAVYIVTRTTEAVIHYGVSQRQKDFNSGVLAEEVSRMLIGYLTGQKRSSKAVAG